MRKRVEQIATAILAFMLTLTTIIIFLQYTAPVPYLPGLGILQLIVPVFLLSLYGVVFCGPFLLGLIYLTGDEETWTRFTSSEPSICVVLLVQVFWIFLVLTTPLATQGGIYILLAVCWIGLIAVNRDIRNSFRIRGGRAPDILAGLLLIYGIWTQIAVFLYPYYMPGSEISLFLLLPATNITVIAYGFHRTRSRMMKRDAFLGGYVLTMLVALNIYLAVFTYNDMYWMSNPMLRSILADALLPLAEVLIFVFITYPLIRPYILEHRVPQLLYVAYILTIASYLPFFLWMLTLYILSPYVNMPMFLLVLSVIGLAPLLDDIRNRLWPGASGEQSELKVTTQEMAEPKLRSSLGYLQNPVKFWSDLETVGFLILCAGISLSFFPIFEGQPIGFYMFMNPLQIFVALVVLGAPILLSAIAIASLEPKKEDLGKWRFMLGLTLTVLINAYYIFFIMPAWAVFGMPGFVIQLCWFSLMLFAYRGTRNYLLDFIGWVQEYYGVHRGSISTILFFSSLFMIAFAFTESYYRNLAPLIISISAIIALATGRTFITTLVRTIRSTYSKRSERRRSDKWMRLVNTAKASIKRIDDLFEDRPAFFYEELVQIADQEQQNAVKALVGLRGIANPDSSDELSTIDDLESRLQEIYRQTIAEAESFVPAGARTTTHMLLPSDGKVEVVRGCEIIGGTFEFKPKVMNKSGSVITNVTVSIVAYPDDCLEIAGEKSKTISRIEVGGFRSPQFLFTPTKDCVEGNVVATVSYLDYKDQVQTIDVRPYTIRSVCDLLKPLTLDEQQLDLVLDGMSSTSDEQTVEWNPQVLFSKTKRLLAAKNFYGTDSEEHIAAGQYVGTIRGVAQGKYTGKRVATIISITGAAEGTQAHVKIDVLGDDIAMLPTTIEELAEGIDSWICMSCGAPLEPEQVTLINSGAPTQCSFCFSDLIKAQYSLRGEEK
ncbi:MAG: hypothetical protein EAX95_07655 [Candidatus Thorarchaeota archaeon]|nr:hypothetical protein [Candidatus Thorarchaeota archaeon]